MSTQDSLDAARLDLIWGRTPPRTHGPKPTLSVEQIALAAIDLADGVGVDGLSMKRLAEVLGVGTMTLYTYVPDKATLLTLMLDRVVATVELPAASDGWRDHLRQAAVALLELYQRHPWLMQINVDGPPIGPGQMRYLESILGALRRAGMRHQASLETAMALSYFTLGAARLTRGILEAERTSTLGPEELQTRRVEAFSRLLDPAEFPTVLEVMTAQPEGPPPADIWDSLGFGFGLERLLDGIAAYLEARS